MPHLLAGGLAQERLTLVGQLRVELCGEALLEVLVELIQGLLPLLRLPLLRLLYGAATVVP